MANVVVIGSFNMDVTVFADRLPSPGETVLGDRSLQCPGGKGSNQAIAAARLGADVCFVGCVGGDEFGRQAMSIYQAEGVDAQYVDVVEAATGMALIVVDHNGENQIAVSPGANRSVTPALVERSRRVIESADVMIGQLETSTEAFLAAARIARSADTTVVLDPAPARRLPDELWSLVDVVTPNHHELARLCVPLEQPSTSSTLVSLGVNAVVVTRGGDGAELTISGGERQSYEAIDVDVVDTTGAGDAFCAGVAVGLAEGDGLNEAVGLGMRAGAYTVTKPGVYDAFPTRSGLQT